MYVRERERRREGGWLHRLHGFVYVCLYTFLYMYMCIYMCIYIYIDTCICTYIYSLITIIFVHT